MRARELDGEAFTIWYVYRDGHWVSAKRGYHKEADVSELESDLRATAEDIAADAYPAGRDRGGEGAASGPTIRGWSSSVPRARRLPIAWSPETAAESELAAEGIRRPAVPAPDSDSSILMGGPHPGRRRFAISSAALDAWGFAFPGPLRDELTALALAGHQDHDGRAFRRDGGRR